ncbi:MAG: RNA polymerase sigma-70 factor [Dysgonamonadaceae bacterium]|jgi:RNA polymerase sigma-70 factor (ECF subfamily)|nr:RNA polymerase sigma-70 factor [Dysgonamonadaceae bacterium]
MNHSDTEIIAGLKQGSNWAYKQLYEHHYVPLCKVASTFLSDDFLAQTIVDDLIVNLYEKRESLNISSSLRAYLIRSVRNRCLNHFQLKYETQEVKFSTINTFNHWLLTSLDANDYPLGKLIEKELEQKINESIERLPPECREVFKKSRFEDKKYEEIAEEMNISVNTVKYHIKNALQILRKDLDRYLLSIFMLLG